MSARTAYSLGELYEVHNGLSKASKFFGTGYPFIAFKDVFNNYFIPKTPSGLVQSTPKEQDSYSVNRGDILITRTSETHDELGMSSVALIDYPHATYNGFTKRLRPTTDLVHPEFIGYYLRAPFFRAGFQQFSSMTTRASLKNEELLNMQVLLPSMEEQKRLASILMAYDNLIENNRRQIALLEEAAQRLYREWFIDLRFPGHDAVKSIGGVPAGWSRVKLGKYAPFKRGKVITAKQTKPGAIPVIAGGLEPAYYHEAPNTSGPVVTVSGSGANAGFTRLYLCDVWASDCSYADMNTNENLLFVYLSVKVLGRDFRHLQRGSAQPHVYPTHINDLDLLVPPCGVLDQFNHIITAQYEAMRVAEQSIANAREARNRLLPKLMSGEIQVKG